MSDQIQKTKADLVIPASVQEEPDSFYLTLGLTLSEVSVLNQFCTHLRIGQLTQDNRCTEQQSRALMHLLHRINNHIQPDCVLPFLTGDADEQP
ncbi:hypothetical protein [Endozoicomonas elysicola]|uniref:Uncharacterized protein n=1 Tax=Endozoicomonas elysicola TaxID=305900 RepID=A0A081KAW9_9GAMM|nr:hypothetical protein [Endozoicomonas elysicola]KEI71295.1 hypothetical protein GV64_11600 [Endozoicomonas elysicola]